MYNVLNVYVDGNSLFIITLNIYVCDDRASEWLSRAMH